MLQTLAVVFGLFLFAVTAAIAVGVLVWGAGYLVGLLFRRKAR